MTTTLTSASVLLTSTNMTDVYQAPTSGLGAQIFNLVAMNYDGTNSSTVSIVRTDSSNTILAYLNPSSETIPAGMGQRVADYMILSAGQKIRAQAANASRISVDLSSREDS